MGKKSGEDAYRGYHTMIGARIKHWRKLKLQKLQHEIGDDLGVAGNAVSLWERGGRMTQDNIMGFMKKFNISADWLLLGREMFTGAIWYDLEMLPEQEREQLKKAINLLVEQAKARHAATDVAEPLP